MIYVNKTLRDMRINFHYLFLCLQEGINCWVALYAIMYISKIY